MIKAGDRVRWNNGEVWCWYGSGGTVIGTQRTDVISDRYRRRGSMWVTVKWDYVDPKNRANKITNEQATDLECI
jgi:hypothetical protein